MKKIKEFLDLTFWCIIIVLAFTIIVSIATNIYKNIRISKKIKTDDICIEINKELYCRVDYDINITYNGSEL